MGTEIKLLGRGSVSVDEGAVAPSAWRTSKTFDLLRVLALSVGRPVETDSLEELFWPDVEHTRAGTSLRTAAFQIRRVLGPERLVRVGHALMLQDVWVDVGAYRALGDMVTTASREGHAARVVDLVRRAEELYAADLDVTGTDCGVLHETRDELLTLRVSLLLEAAEAAGSYGDWKQSLVFAQRASATETSDRATRALMQAWFAVGETAKPVEEFERLRRHLAEYYGVDPAPQTRALYLDVVTACAEWPPRESMIGRDDEVRDVVSAVTNLLKAPDDHTGIVWLVGAPGSGRTAIAREAARSLMVPLALTEPDPPPSTPERGMQRGRQGGVVLELLSDQGTVTKGLAAMLRLRATTWSRTMLVPVSALPADVVDPGDFVVEVPPLAEADFRRLMALILQGTPGRRLEAELWQGSSGLPGLACRLARQRLKSGDLTWTPRGVDSAATSTSTWRSRVLPALLAIPFAVAALLAVEAGAENEARAQYSEEHTRPPGALASA